MKTTAEEKCRIVREMCSVTQETLLYRISKMPDTWDGVELRLLFSDLAAEFASSIKDRRRIREYKNTRTVEGI